VAAPVPISDATRRMVTAANPSASATAIAARVIWARVCSAGRPTPVDSGRIQIISRATGTFCRLANRVREPLS
jgi:hypothetical protein